MKFENSIQGIGTDIEEIARFEELPFAQNTAFYQNIFTEAEIQYCLSKSKPEQHFTARFCAKEAVMKALGDKTRFNLKDIEIFNDKKGQPQVVLPSTEAKSKGLKVSLSMSHCKSHALAFCIVSGRAEVRPYGK